MRRGERQDRISWGIHGLPKVALRRAMLCHSTSCGRPPLKRLHGRFRVSCLQSWRPAVVLLPFCIPREMRPWGGDAKKKGIENGSKFEFCASRPPRPACGRMARGGHGLTKASLGPANPTLRRVGRSPLKHPYSCFRDGPFPFGHPKP
jgi:hypothetical protein